MKTRYMLGAIVVTTAAMSFGALAQTVGSVAALNRNATGEKPGAKALPLGLGGPIAQRERIQTDADGTVSISFSDRSAMSVGRASSVVVDNYVYNAQSGAGQMSINFARGAMRFVGGQVSHETGAQIKTPVATIGVRGGIAVLYHDKKGGLHVVGNFGTVCVENPAGKQCILRPGFEVVVTSGKTPPSAPVRVDPGALAAVMASLTSHGGQDGGAKVPPTDEGSAKFGIGSPRPDVITPIPTGILDNTIVQQRVNTRNQPTGRSRNFVTGTDSGPP